MDESIKEIGRTKAQVLRAIKSYDIANKNCSKIGSEDIVAFANQLVAKMTPQTVANYLSHLGAVFAVAVLRAKVLQQGRASTSTWPF